MNDRNRHDVSGHRAPSLPSGRSPFVAASFKDVDDAVAAARGLEASGYTHDQISVFMSEAARTGYREAHPNMVIAGDGVTVDSVQLKRGHKTLEGAATGGAVGGAIGAVAAVIAAVGTTLVVPAIGLVVAGPVAAAFAGAGAGGATGGLVGALVGSGMSEYRATRFERAVKAGHIIVGVEARTDAERNDLIERLDKMGGGVIAEAESLAD